VNRKFKHIVQDDMKPVAQLLTNASLFSNWLCGNAPEELCLDQCKGQTFFGRCISAMRGCTDCKIPARIISAFHEATNTNTVNLPDRAPGLSHFLNPFRNLMACDAMRSVEELFIGKVHSYFAHALRREGYCDELLSYKELKSKTLNLSKMLVDQLFGNGVWEPQAALEQITLDMDMNNMSAPNTSACRAVFQEMIEIFEQLRFLLTYTKLKKWTRKGTGTLPNWLVRATRDGGRRYHNEIIQSLVIIGQRISRDRKAYESIKKGGGELEAFMQHVPESFSPLPLKTIAPNFFLYSETSIQYHLMRANIKASFADSPWWWKDVLNLDGPEFTIVRGKGKQRRAMMKTPGVVTSSQALEALHPGSDPPPWIVAALRINAREVHLVLKTIWAVGVADAPEWTRPPTPVPWSEPSWCEKIATFLKVLSPGPSAADLPTGEVEQHEPRINLHRRPTEGIQESYHAGFGEVRKGNDLNPRKEGGQSKGLFANMEKVNLDELVRKFVLIDPGQLQFVSIQTAEWKGSEVRLNDDWMALTGDNWRIASGGNILSDFELERRKENPQYAMALKELALCTKRTCDVSDFNHYCRKYAQHEAVLVDEAMLWKRRSLRFKVRIMRQRALDTLANIIKAQGEICCFGNGSCTGRGHKRVPVKALIRAIATKMPVLVIDEWGTSSRCPRCKTKGKMDSHRKRPCPSSVSAAVVEGVVGAAAMVVEVAGDCVAAAELRGGGGTLGMAAGDAVSAAVAGAVVGGVVGAVAMAAKCCKSIFAPFQRVERDVSKYLKASFVRPSELTDDRIEICRECNIYWDHDGVSPVNFADIVNAMLRGEPRPARLSPSKKTETT
jgi:hypothetical protein